MCPIRKYKTLGAVSGKKPMLFGCFNPSAESRGCRHHGITVVPGDAIVARRTVRDDRPARGLSDC